MAGARISWYSHSNANGVGLGLYAAGGKGAVSRKTPRELEIACENVMKRLPDLVLPRRHTVSHLDINPRYLNKILLRTYERAPKNFEGLLSIERVGPRTLRALALAAELIYGAPASTRDPARFSFAHGGKDGTPFPVDRQTYDRTITILNQALNRAKVDRSEKVRALKRLALIEHAAESLGSPAAPA